jgi:FixJ family two-component response regulator
MLPKLSGVEVQSRICAAKPQLRVIFATGYSGAGTLAKKLDSGAYLVLQKPYSRGELARRIRETLDKDKDDVNVNSQQSS